MEILARLDRATGLRVLCGMTNEQGAYTCRQHLARVAIIEKPTVSFEGPTLVPGDRVLCMLTGWIQRPVGHWTPNNHSVRLQRVAARKVSRGELDPAQLLAQGRARNRRPITRLEGFDSFRETYGLANDNHVEVLGPKGILADCPRCGHVNTLTASRLRVAEI